MASVSEKVTFSLAYHASRRIVSACCMRKRSASRMTSEYSPSTHGVVRATAWADHCRWVSSPRWARAAAKVPSTCPRNPNHSRTCRGGTSNVVQSNAWVSNLPSAVIPHRAPDLDVFLAIKPRIPLAQECEQVPVLISQIQDHESLAWNVEHMNPHEVVEDPACGRGLNASAFLVREGHLRVLQRSADAVL